MKSLSLADIRIDGGTQVRAEIDQHVVADYAEAMTTGVKFPPIVVFHDGSDCWLADGFHRVMAAQRLSVSELDADVRPGTRDDALWFALGANGRHGKRLVERDVRRAVELAVRTWPNRSGSQIAEQVGCSQSRVSAIKDRMRATASPTDTLPDRVIGKDGRSYPATLQKERPVEHPKRAEVVERVRAGKSSKDICAELGVRSELVAEVRRGIGVAKADTSRDAVRERGERMRTMASEGYTTRQISAAVGVGENCVKDIAKRECFEITADKAVGSSKRHDSNRILETIVADAENITAGTNLIDFATVDQERLGEWIDSLAKSRRALDGFIKRLIKEQKNGKAA